MSDDLSPEDVAKVKFDPNENHEAISIILQPDGNYRGFAYKHGKLVQARARDPGTVLTLLITHE